MVKKREGKGNVVNGVGSFGVALPLLRPILVLNPYQHNLEADGQKSRTGTPSGYTEMPSKP
jgi:hypothetical protein